MTNTSPSAEYYLERARLARERASKLTDDEAARRQEIKLAQSYEELARAELRRVPLVGRSLRTEARGRMSSAEVVGTKAPVQSHKLGET